VSEATAVVPARPWFADWRVWLGIAITLLSLWYVGKDVPFEDVPAANAHADLWLLLLWSVPAHVLGIVVRAWRWRHLTNPIAPMSRMLLYRAQSIGFVANNIFPLRMGELIRSWYLARETHTRGAAILGTVVIERVLDIVMVLLMAGAAVAWLGLDAGDGLLARAAWLMLPAACLPVLGLVVLRLAPELVVRVFGVLTRPLPETVAEFVEGNLRRFIEGLAALSGGFHLLWILFHTIVIWLVVATLPILGALIAFDVELGSPTRLVVGSWVLLAAIGVMVALPSAPGFVGTYQLAFKAVLEPLGVDPATALALGIVVWVVFWCTFTFQGLVAMRLGGTSLRELAVASGKAPPEARR